MASRHGSVIENNEVHMKRVTGGILRISLISSDILRLEMRSRQGRLVVQR